MKKSRCSARAERRRTTRSPSSAKAQHVYGSSKSHVSSADSRTGSGRRSNNRNTPVAISSARCLLLQVQKAIKTEGLYRAKSIMDVILDANQYRVDKLFEAIQLWNWQNRGFINEDVDSLDAYWVSQAAIRNNARVVMGPAAGGSPQYPVSTERSTALWSAALDGDFGRDCDHHSDFECDL
jgi:hypothetical protein